MRYICSRCLRLLSQDLRRSPSRLAEFPYPRIFSSATSHCNTYSSLAAKGDENNQDASTPSENGAKVDEPPRTRSWSALLKKKALGQASSVLVLRDSEAKKNARKHSSEQDNVANPASDTATAEANRILTSMKDQSSAPDESEVFENIAALRPDIDKSLGSFEERPLLSLARYNRCVAKLAESFTRKQLKAFIANRLGSDGAAQQRAADEVSSRNKLSDKTNNVVKTERPPKPSRSTPVQSLGWKPVTSNERVSDESDKKRTRSKYIAGKVVRLVWGFEIKEYVAGRGSLDADVEATLLPLLLIGGRNSALMDFGKSRGMKIEVNRAKKRLTIKGTKEECLRVVEDLNKLLRHAFAIQVPVEPAVAESIQRCSQGIAEDCKCVAEISKSMLVIRGLNQASVKMCQRVLASQIHASSMGREICHIVGDSERYLIPSTAIAESLPYQLRREGLGRLSMPLKFATDAANVAARNNSDAIFEPHLRDSICALLLDNNRALEANSGVQSQLVAEFGHVLHSIGKIDLLRPIPSVNLPRSLTHFAPTTIGLPQFLLHSFPGPESEAQVENLLIRLRPSPWKSMPNSGSASDWPDLEMILSRRNKSSQFQDVWIRAMLNRQAANIMIPALNTDIRFVRQDVRRLSHEENHASIGAFVQALQRSAAGFDELTPPVFLKLLIPKFMQRRVESRPEKKESVEELTKVNYFVTGWEQAESIVSAHDGHILSYYRNAGDVTNGSREGLSLQKAIEPFANSEDRSRATNAKEDVDSFISAAEAVLKDINSPLNDEAWSQETSHNSQRGGTWTTRGDYLSGAPSVRRVLTAERHTRANAAADRPLVISKSAVAAAFGK